MKRRERVDGQDVSFDDIGKGPALVLLPPFPFDRRIWADTIPALLGADRRVIALDYPGFGESPPSAQQPAIADLADLVAGVLDHLGLVSAGLVGLSMGGYVALAFASRFPDRLDALVLADTRAAADTPKARDARANALTTVRDRGADAYLAQSIPTLLAATAAPETKARALGLAEKRPDALLGAITAMRDRPDRTAELPTIACPTLVVVGQADTVTPPAEMRAMAADIPGAAFVVIPAAGHLSSFEAPLDFNLALMDFLRGVPTLPTTVEPE